MDSKLKDCRKRQEKKVIKKKNHFFPYVQIKLIFPQRGISNSNKVSSSEHDAKFKLWNSHSSHSALPCHTLTHKHNDMQRGQFESNTSWLEPGEIARNNKPRSHHLFSHPRLFAPSSTQQHEGSDEHEAPEEQAMWWKPTKCSWSNEVIRKECKGRWCVG